MFKLRSISLLVSAAALGLFGVPVKAATPFTQATVTRLQNTVNYGEVKAGKTVTRPANVSDVIRSGNFLLTQTQARAELQYPDGSVVRIGQDTVFTFEAETRALTLEKGALLFYIPKGTGGGQIKTPSLTAAITGTMGKVSEHVIAILEGEVTLVPSGQKVPAGSFARRNANGSITVARFDLAKAGEGKLMSFNGPMPGAPRLAPGPADVKPQFKLDLSILDQLEVLDRTNASPSAIERFFPKSPSRPAAHQDQQRELPSTPPRAIPEAKPAFDPEELRD